MEFAIGALSSLLPKLHDLLREEYNLQKGAKKNLQFLERELESMHIALHKVGNVPLDQLDEQVRIWARDIRELSYDMEDIIDTFLVRVEGRHPHQPRSSKGLVKRMVKLFKKGSTHRQILEELKDIKDRIKEVANRRERYNVAIVSPATTMIDARLRALYAKTTDLVGIDMATNDLIMRFTNGGDGMPTRQQKVVSIVGFGGLGKTTIAKAVYDKLKGQFECAAFVSVSRNPDLKKVFKDILCELDKGRHMSIHNSAWDEKQLIDQLRDFLQGKRYFIVIDDIWDIISWNIIRCALGESDIGSCILTTTRNNDIADRVGEWSYRLQPLSHENSKILFYRRIFGSEDKCPKTIIEVSTKILKKCGGVPLAIVSISSLLANKLDNITEWSNICDSIGSGLENDNDMNGMRKILSLSYYDLPSHLKTCFLDLSTFPEDYEIRKDRLIWRWIAEGFVQPGKMANNLFELGESYFFELINRSMIHPVEMDEQGRAQACRMHDMVLDLICSLSREENFVNISRGVEESTFWRSKIRRLSLQENIRANMNVAQVRSFTIFSSAINSMPSLSCFHVVRVLDLEGCDLKGCGHLNLRYIANLIHLRYLGLRHTFVDELPENIRRLQFLQTLDLSRTLIEELPSGIVQLRQLMCLSVNYNTRLPNGLRNMTSLEVLETVRVDEDSTDIVKDLGLLSQLRVVRIDFNLQRWEGLGERVGKALVESFNSPQKIQSLEITDFSGEDEHMKEGWVPPPRLRRFVMWTASSVSTWISPASLLLLSYLDIEVHKIEGNDIQILGMLPSLRHLWLGASGHLQELPVEERFMVSADAFPCARVCKFFNFVTVPSMFPRGAMPRVEHLEFCLRPSRFFTDGDFDLSDLGMGHLPSLDRVVVNLHSERADSKEDVGEVEKGLRHAACAHPNYPSIDVRHH
ncbi:hypothetical protein C2845_PM18G13260 [Panicum miliaceum]|uniref:Disease resistance RPP13-like protein 3 n=1 Tax=Panicum miliaceum TaxID=4540 RepID=A0A3L6PJ85_PANMI|nr:hypothetical protein C2845_PM18G13260 [Panicum miliaceum]